MAPPAWFASLPFYKRLTVIATAITAVLGALMAISNAMGLAEPYWVATRGFVAEKIEAAVQVGIGETRKQLGEAKHRQIGIEIRIETGEKRRLQGRIADLELELRRNPEAPESLRRLIEEQIRQHRDDLANSEANIRELRWQQSGWRQ